jgi:hypothetical protein
MPLYLVRWPLLEASIIRARDESDLMEKIDEIADPSLCTWRVYAGPLWIDFRLPLVRIDQKHPGPLEPDELVIDNPDLAVGDLAVERPEGSDTAGEMDDQVRRMAFPHLTGVIDHRNLYDDEPLSEDQRELLRQAIIDEVMRHDERTKGVAVSFRDGRLYRAKVLYFVKDAGETFRPIKCGDAERFCVGPKRLRPSADGYVRLVGLRIEDRGGSKVGRITDNVRLRTKADGLVEAAHRADAFDNVEGNGAAGDVFERKRNETVQWRLTADELREIASVTARRVGPVKVIEPDHAGPRRQPSR